MLINIAENMLKTTDRALLKQKLINHDIQRKIRMFYMFSPGSSVINIKAFTPPQAILIAFLLVPTFTFASQNVFCHNTGLWALQFQSHKLLNVEESFLLFCRTVLVLLHYI